MSGIRRRGRRRHRRRSAALVFISCHPVLSTEGRVALLRLLGGLTTQEISRAFLTPIDHRAADRACEANLSEARRSVRGTTGPDRAALSLGTGSHLSRFQRGLLGDRRRRLDAPGTLRRRAAAGAILAELAPQEPEVHGLVALMEIQASRTRARVDANGEPVLLLDRTARNGITC